LIIPKSSDFLLDLHRSFVHFMEKLFSLPPSHQVTKMNLNKIIFLCVFVPLWQFSPARPPHSARQEGGLIRIGVLKIASPLENNDLKVKHNLPKPRPL